MPTPTDARTAAARPRQYDLLGVPVSALDLHAAVAAIRGLAQRPARPGPAAYVCVRDVNGIVACQDDPRLRRVHEEAALVTPDGMPVVWWGRLRGFAETDRVYGPDLMAELCRISPATGLRHFLCGGDDGVAGRLAARLEARYPGLAIAGTFTPPFRPLGRDEHRTLAALIESSGANVIWVGLSSPKQELFMADLAAHLRGGVLIGVGAAFDFLSGRKPQAPRWLQRSGCEWLFRLITEPGRLWRRYLFGNSRFVWLALRQLVAEARAGAGPEMPTPSGLAARPGPKPVSCAPSEDEAR